VAFGGVGCAGQIIVDVPSIGADFYVADLHKWYFNPRGSAFIWVRVPWFVLPEKQ